VTVLFLVADDRNEPPLTKHCGKNHSDVYITQNKFKKIINCGTVHTSFKY